MSKSNENNRPLLSMYLGDLAAQDYIISRGHKKMLFKKVSLMAPAALAADGGNNFDCQLVIVDGSGGESLVGSSVSTSGGIAKGSSLDLDLDGDELELPEGSSLFHESF